MGPDRSHSMGMAPAGTELSLCRLDGDTDIALSDAWSCLSPEEEERANRFRFALHRERYVRGRGFLRRSLANTMRTDPRKIVISQGAQGKPMVPDGPEFNLSHSRDLAVLAMSETGPVGVDLEFLERDVNPLGLARNCFVDYEIEVLLNLDDAERHERFFSFWTAKEALMKLTGQGMSLAPKSISLELDRGWPVGFSRPETPRATLHFPTISVDKVICCLAFPGGG